VAPAQLQAARAAGRVLAAVSLPLHTLFAAVTWSRRFRTRTPFEQRVWLPDSPRSAAPPAAGRLLGYPTVDRRPGTLLGIESNSGQDRAGTVGRTGRSVAPHRPA